MKIPINENAPARTKNQIEISAPIEIVWKILTNIDDWPKWQKSVSEAVMMGSVEEGTKFNWKAGGLSFKSCIHTSKPNKEFGWTGVTFGASAIHNWKFAEKGNKTIVNVEESLQGVFPKFFKGFFQKELDKGVLTNLEELKTASEKMT